MPFINAIGTASPQYVFAQHDILAFMQSYLRPDAGGLRKLKALYKQTAIAQRHSVIPDFGVENAHRKLFYENAPSTHQRMKLYQQEALPLAQAAIDEAWHTIPDLEPEQVTHLITVSCTGMYAPGLDIDLLKHYQLPTSVQRTCVNFMGCYAAFNALKLAQTICLAQPQAVVLVVAVELCTLHLQNSLNEDDLLSGAIFADGAGAMIVSKYLSPKLLEIKHFHTDIALHGAADMAWHIGDTGFEMRLSAYIPNLVEQALPTLLQRLQTTYALPKDEVLWAMHPGGKRILQAIEKALQISPAQNQVAYKVLQQYGNMSSVTIIFVWKELITQLTAQKRGKQVVSIAFGPGLTIESTILSVV